MVKLKYYRPNGWITLNSEEKSSSKKTDNAIINVEAIS